MEANKGSRKKSTEGKDFTMPDNKTILNELLEHGKANGKLTTKEITDALETCEFDADQIDKLYDDFEAFNIDHVKVAWNNEQGYRTMRNNIAKALEELKKVYTAELVAALRNNTLQPNSQEKCDFPPAN